MSITISKNCAPSDAQPSNMSKEIWVNKFDENSARIFREQVLDRASMDPNAPIVIYIDSYGGFVDSLASMLATMDEVPNPLITVAVGKSASCGAILLSHGDYRYCDRYARVMVHEIQSASWGNMRTLENDVKESRRLNRKFMELLAQNCGMKDYGELKAKFKEADADDLWMDAEEAVKFGLVDFVGVPKVMPVVTFQCATVPKKESLREAKTRSDAEKKADKPQQKKVAKAAKKLVPAPTPAAPVKPSKKVK